MNTYPSIKEIYEQRRFDNRIKHEERIAHVYSICPALKECDKKLSILTIEQTMKNIQGNSSSPDSSYSEAVNQLNDERERLIEEYKLPKDYLEDIFTCKDCRDQGFIDGVRCHCYISLSARMLFQNSPIRRRMEQENFSNFDFSCYSDNVSKEYGISPRENIRRVYDSAKQFISGFPDGTNMLLHGATGVGKTFLTNCIAKDLMDLGHTVSYLTATQFFEVLADHSFHRASPETEDMYNYIVQSELLIIDDLGTELNNEFVATSLFNCMNVRALQMKSTIISTNLSIKQIEQKYSKRIASES